MVDALCDDIGPELVTNFQRAGMEVSIWAAMKLPGKEQKIQIMAAQASNPKIPRRIIKTHEPVETVPFNAANKHLFVGRDYRDIVWSWYTHHSNFHPDVFSKINAPTDYPFKPLPAFNAPTDYPFK